MSAELETWLARILITPFHSMLLMCPATQSQDIERFLGVFAQFCTELRSSLRCRS